MKLIKLNNGADDDYYLLNVERVVENDWCFRSGKILQGTLPEIVAFANEVKTPKVIASSSDSLNTLAGIPKLNKKEIEELLNEVDVIKLAEEMVQSHPDFKAEGMSDYQNGRFNGIIDGYNKALENNADKKFTLQDIENCFNEAKQPLKFGNFQQYKEYLFWDENRKNGWDVEVEMEKSNYVVSGGLRPMDEIGGKGLETHWSYKIKVNEQGFVKINSIKK